MESVQRHSSNRHGNSDDGQMDFSLTAIDLPAMKAHLSGVIGSNKDRWKELSVHGVNTHILSVFRGFENVSVSFITQRIKSLNRELFSHLGVSLMSDSL